MNDFGNGFLGGSAEGLASLQKAMQAGNITGRDTANQSLGQEPLKVESLETTLKLLEFRQKDLTLFSLLPKLKAYNTVEEYLQLKSYGEERGGFYGEGELSDVEDSTYVRRAELVKYMQVTGEVTMQAQMVRSFVPAMRQEVENKMKWILRLANSSLTKADSEIVPQQFNSLYKQHQSVGTSEEFIYSTLEEYYNDTTVIDLRGKSLTQYDIENGAVNVDASFGSVSHLCAPTKVISGVSQEYFETQRILQGGTGVSGKFGTVAKSISTTLGDVDLAPDKFMGRKPEKTNLSQATSLKSPSAPVVATLELVTDNLAKFGQAEAGNVFYAVSALNRYGESALTVFATPVSITEGQSVEIAMTASSGANATSGFQIYRTEVTAAATSAGLNFFPIFEVSAAQAAAGYENAGQGKVRDRGYFMPNTEQAFLTEMSDEVLSFKELAPISKLDLAVQSMSNRFICFLFGTPIVYAPRKMVRYINIGKFQS